ncbi:MAG: hypothetical protein WA584_03965 [Pyrinomonadaceae bacterium]
MKKLYSLIFILLFSFAAFAQTETLTNLQIVEMSKAGLAAEIVLKKIESSRVDFNVSTGALIELKKSGVADEIISAMLEKAEANKKYSASSNTASYSDSTGVKIPLETKPDGQIQPSGKILSPKEALFSAKTIALEKSSLQPSRQALEKELMKRKDWQALNLTIERYKESADLYVEIGYVSLSWITHRYVYRVYDRRSGAVLAAGETTSWGSLAENLARHISKSLNQIAGGALK